MEVVALDGVKLTVLMVAGGVFALVGLLFMFRAKQEGGSARLELLGQKFEATSTGIIVFLIGAAFLATPLFVPERQVSPPGSVLSTAGGKTDAQPDSVKEDGVRPADILQPRDEKEEVETNNSVSEANMIEVGQTVSGETRVDDPDWFVFRTKPQGKRQLNATFRIFGDRGCGYLDVLDADENRLGGDLVCFGDNPGSVNVGIVTGAYYIRVTGADRFVYEFVLSYR